MDTRGITGQKDKVGNFGTPRSAFGFCKYSPGFFFKTVCSKCCSFHTYNIWNVGMRRSPKRIYHQKLLSHVDFFHESKKVQTLCRTLKRILPCSYPVDALLVAPQRSPLPASHWSRRSILLSEPFPRLVIARSIAFLQH